MITIDMLNQNAALSALTDAQKAAIAELSKNDEATVIGTKIGALHGQYDADILGISGIAKNAGEKSYDYAKRDLNNYKTQLGSVDTLKSQIETQKTEITSLKEKLASNSTDETLKQQLSDAQNRVSELQKQLKAKVIKVDIDKLKELSTSKDKKDELDKKAIAMIPVLEKMLPVVEEMKVYYKKNKKFFLLIYNRYFYVTLMLVVFFFFSSRRRHTR